MGVWRTDEYDPPTSCYCCWLAGVGGMPPCSWCTDPANNPDEDSAVDETPEETDIERFDRVMRELVGRP